MPVGTCFSLNKFLHDCTFLLIRAVVHACVCVCVCVVCLCVVCLCVCACMPVSFVPVGAEAE